MMSAGRPVETTDSRGPEFGLLLEKPCLVLAAMPLQRITAVHCRSREAVETPSLGYSQYGAGLSGLAQS